MIEFKNIKYKNFLSSGNYFTTIPLNVHKDTLIVGNNGSGKSTLLDALTFSLFGKPFRRITKSQLINSVNERDAKVEIEFSISNVDYQVVRGINLMYLRFTKMDKNLMKTPLQTINKSIWKDKYSNSTTNLSLKLLYLAVLLSFPLCNLVLHIVGRS